MTGPRRTGGLGRGLGALIPTAPRSSEPDTAQASDATPHLEPVAGAHFAELPLEAIVANPDQPRGHFDDEAMAELVTSIREVGLLQPVVVREVTPVEGGRRYELVMGERRWRACREVGTGTIPAIVRATGDEAMLRDALLENLHRQALNPLEEAAAYSQLLQDFGVTHEQLASRLGRSRPQISNTIRLLQLPGPVQRRVAAGVLSAGHARAILGLATGAQQELMASRVAAEGLSVRAVEEAVALAGSESGDERPPRPPRARQDAPPRLAEVADTLSDRLDTRVTVDLGRSKGKVTIEFASLEDLERILAELAPAAS